MVLTIAERIRRQAQQGSNASLSVEKRSNTQPELAVSLLSIDEKIAALENVFSQSDSNSDTDSDDDDHRHSAASITDREGQKTYSALVPETDEKGRLMRLVSTLSTERIPPLPRSMLPSSSCGARSLKPGQLPADERPNKVHAPRTIRFSDESFAENDDAGQKEIEQKSKRSRTAEPPRNFETKTRPSGLQTTVRELLKTYEPASLEKRPFWCRICRYQATDEASLISHRATESHEVAARLDAKASRCELCRKQFTSPAQLKEHLGAKGHKERLERVKKEQTHRKKFS